MGWADWEGRSALAAFSRSMVEYDMSRARPWSAIRRTVVVLATMAAVWSASGPRAVASIGMAAMLVGFLDRQQSPRRTIRVMSAGTIALATTQLVANVLGPWPVLILALVVAIAFAEGASAGLDADAPIIAHFCGTIAATAAVTGSHAGPPGATAAAVLAAGALQTGLTWLSGRIDPRVREFGLVAHELDLIAAALDQLARDPDPRHPGPATRAHQESASRNMTATQRAIDRSDLSARMVELLTLVLWGADQVRIEARALAAHGVAGTSPTVDAVPAAVSLSRQLHHTAATLRMGAQVLEQRGQARQRAATVLLESQNSQWLAGTHLAAARADFVAGVVQLTAEDPVRVGPSQPPAARAAITAALVPGSLSFRLGARIALSSLVAMLAAAGLGITHASWASNAVLSMLRPDGGATLPRIAMRAVAVSCAALTVVGVALAGDGRRVWLLAAMALAIYAGYWLGPVNYGVFGFTITVAVLMILAATGSDPLEIAQARWLDTLVGCAVALVAAFAMPVWRIEALPSTLAGASSALSDWLVTIARAAADPAGHRDIEALLRAGARVRDRVSDSLAVTALARLEPPGRMPIARLRLVLLNLRASAQSALAAEHLLVHGSEPSPAAADIALRAGAVAADLANALGRVGPGGMSRRPEAEPALPSDSSSRTGEGVGPPAADGTATALQVSLEYALAAAALLDTCAPGPEP